MFEISTITENLGKLNENTFHRMSSEIFGWMPFANDLLNMQQNVVRKQNIFKQGNFQGYLIIASFIIE